MKRLTAEGHSQGEKVLRYMGTKSGRDGDKAEALGLHTMYIGEVVNAWKK